MMIFLRRFALLAGGLALACGGDRSQQMLEQPPPTVIVAPVREGHVQRVVELVGRTSAIESVELVARVTGFLERRAFVEGSQVERGQLLFQIERAPYAAEISRAEASVADAEARLANARQFEARLKSARTGAVSGSDLDQARADVLAAEAAVAVATAALKVASINLDYTRIHAPITGSIGRASATAGNLVGPSTGVLATIVGIDPIHVTFNVSEREVISARQQALETGEGRPTFIVQLKLANGSRYAHDGTIDFIDPRVDPATGTLAVRAVFPNPDGLLVPGQFVTALVERSDAQPALLISQMAVQQGQGGITVLVVGDDDVVASRQVVLGQRAGTDWVVDEGLEAGERIVVEGWQKVRPGTKVSARPASDDSDSVTPVADAQEGAG